MRRAGLLLLSLTAAAGCSPHESAYVSGTATYIANPPTSDATGTLPLKVAYCSDLDRVRKYDVAIRIADDCVLRRTAPRPHEPPRYEAVDGTCILPTATGELHFDRIDDVHVEAPHRYARRFDVVVSGTTIDRTYATYHFQGSASEPMAWDECTALMAP